MAGENAQSAQMAPIFVWAVFPVADLRSLLDPEQALVTKPWSETNQDRFLRRFGPLRYAKDDPGRGSMPSWLRATESWYIAAGRFARVLPKEPRSSADLGNGFRAAQATACRLFADPLLNARLEIVIRIWREGDVDADLHELLSRIAQLDVEVRESRKGHRAPQRSTVKLAALGQYFRDAYARALLPAAAAAAARAAAAKGEKVPALTLVRRLEPLFVVYDSSPLAESLTQIKWTKEVRTGKSTFRALAVKPGARDAAGEQVRAIRRTFVRMQCMTEATLSLFGALTDQTLTSTVSDLSLKRIESLVQQAEAGAAALRSQPDIAFTPLEIALERLGSAIQRLVGYLDQSKRTPPIGVLRGFQARQAAQAPLLSDDVLRKIYDLAIEQRLFKNRSGLLTGLDPSIEGHLLTDNDPACQVWLDLNTLNRMVPRDDGDQPLATWLRNAALLSVDQPMVAAPFTVYAEQVVTCVARRRGGGPPA